MRLRTPVTGTVRFAYHTGGRGQGEVILTGVTIGGKPIAEDVTIPAVCAAPGEFQNIRGRPATIEGARLYVAGRHVADYGKDATLRFCGENPNIPF
jgi:hypothetical protein